MKPPTTPTPKPSSTRPRASSRTKSLFAALYAYYGSEWERRWPEEHLERVVAVWSAELERFDDSVIRLALEALKASGAKFPPSLPEFFALCLQFRPRPTSAPTLAAPKATPPAGIFDQLRKQTERKRSDERES